MKEDDLIDILQEVDCFKQQPNLDPEFNLDPAHTLFDAGRRIYNRGEGHSAGCIHNLSKSIPSEENKIEFSVSPDGGALKHSKGKIQVNEFPLEILECLNEPCVYGKLKGYPRFNFLQGMPYMTLVGSALRHLTAFIDRVEIDSEGKQFNFEPHHINQALWNIALLALEAKHNMTKFDDRPPKIGEKGGSNL